MHHKKLMHIFVIILFLIISLFYSYRFLIKDANWGYHDWDMILSERAYMRETIFKYHQIPLWNPYFCGGNSFIGDPLFPTLSLSLILPVLFPPITGMKINLVIFLVIGMYGMFLLSKHYRLRGFSSLLPSFVFMLSSLFAAHIAEGHVYYLTMSWLPYTFLFFLKSSKKKIYLILSAFFVSLTFLSGGIFLTFMLFIFFFFYSLLIFFNKKQIKIFMHLAIIFFLMIGFTAFKSIPTVFYLKNSQLMDRNRTNLLDKTDINKVYNQFLSHNQSIRAIPNNENEGRTWEWHEYSSYIGILPITLFLMGILLFYKKHWVLIISALVFLFVSFGAFYNINPWKLLSILPVFSSMRVPSRFLLIFLFPFSIIVGITFSYFEAKYLTKSLFKKTIALFIISFILIDLILVARPLLDEALTDIPFKLEPSGEFKQSVNFFADYEKDFNQSQLGLFLGNISKGNPPKYYYSFHPNTVMNRGTIDCDHNYTANANIMPFYSENYFGEIYLLGSKQELPFKFSPNKLSISLPKPTDDTLVVNQNFDNGWKAKSNNGNKLVISHNNMIAVEINKDDKYIGLYYSPYSFVIGLVISLITFLFSVYILISRFMLRKNDIT